MNTDKPVAWVGPEGQLMLDDVYKAWSKINKDDSKHYKPLYYYVDSLPKYVLEPSKAEALCGTNAEPGYWYPINTAPRNGMLIIAAEKPTRDGARILAVWGMQNGWMCNGQLMKDFSPVCWTPCLEVPIDA